MIFCKQFPDKTFATKAEMFDYLAKNAEKIIAIKKANIYESVKKGIAETAAFMPKSATNEAVKAKLKMEDDMVYPVINTTNYMDSHDDVHFPGLWKKSLQETVGKLYYVADHSLTLNNVIAYPENVMAKTVKLPWSMVGKSYEGETEALIFEIKEDNLVHEKAKEAIEYKRPVQNSVRMRYVKIRFGMNSEAKEHAEHKAYYDVKINEIANKEEVEAQGYFYGVEEAQIVKEGSMVLFGSNDATAVLTPMDENSSKGADSFTPDQNKGVAGTTTTQDQTKFINPNLY